MATNIFSNNITATPWALPSWTSGPGRPRRIFFTPSVMTLFNANWASSFTDNVRNYVIYAQGDPASSPIVNALTYVATGDATAAHNAVTQALTVPYQLYGPSFGMTAEPAALIFDWCYPVLTNTEKNNLIAYIDANNTTRQAYMITECNTGGGVLISEYFHRGCLSWLFSAMAIQGEVAPNGYVAVDRNVAMRNFVQNYTLAVDEIYGCGFQCCYQYAEWFTLPIIAWEMATGQTTSSQYAQNRAEGVARLLFGDGQGISSVEGDQVTRIDNMVWYGSSGGGKNGIPGGPVLNGPPYIMWMCAKHFGGTYAGLYQWLGNNALVWFPNWDVTNGAAPAYLGIIFYDSTITPIPPETQFSSHNNHLFGTQRTVNFRSGWSPTGASANNKDVRVWLKATPMSQHNGKTASGSLEVFRGVDAVLPKGSAYWGTSGDYFYNWAMKSFSKNTLTFCPVGSTTPDTSGCQSDFYNQPARWATDSSTYFPQSSNYAPFAAPMGAVTLTDFPAGDAYGMAHIDSAQAWDPPTGTRNVTTCTRKVATIPGASPGQMTIIIRDQFTLVANSIGTIKWGWFCREKPLVVSPYAPVTIAETTNASVAFYGASAPSTPVPFTTTSPWNTLVSNTATYTTITWPADTGFNYVTSWDDFSPGVYLGVWTDPVVTVTYPASWGNPGPTVAVQVPTAVCVGSISGTTLTVPTAPSSGMLQIGMIILSSTNGVTAATRIVAPKLTGAGGAGTYTVDTSQSRGSGTMTFGATGAVGTDSEILIMNGSTCHNFWQFARTGLNTATASSYAQANVLADSGWGTPSPFKGAGINATGSSELGGLLRQVFSDTGTIPYALQLRVDVGHCLTGFVAPAIAGDGGAGANPPGIVQCGQRLAIPKATVMPGGLSALGQTVFTCLQNYGCYVIDTTGGVYGFRANPLDYDAATIIAFIADNAAIIRLLKRVT